MEDARLHETEAYHSLAQLSQHSSLLSEGSAIAEIEKELQAVMGEEVEERRPTPARRSVLQLVGVEDMFNNLVPLFLMLQRFLGVDDATESASFTSWQGCQWWEFITQQSLSHLTSVCAHSRRTEVSSISRSCVLCLHVVPR